MRRELSIPEIETRLLDLPQVDCPVIHRFGPGLYIREVRLPAGCVIVGHRQRYEHMNIFLQGRLTMLNPDGSTMELSAPMMFTGAPGRKCGYIHEDVVWLNIYPTTETDVETLESTYLDKSPVWLDKNRQLEDSKSDRAEDVMDYHRMLGELGITESQVREESECTDDLVPLPLGGYKIAVSRSRIEGKGVFATAQIDPGEIIAPAKLGEKRTPVGRYTNHSAWPNAIMKEYNGDIYLVATRPIHGCQGGFLGDEITTDYRKTLRIVGGMPCLQ
jgi:hypothetical protein